MTNYINMNKDEKVNLIPYVSDIVAAYMSNPSISIESAEQVSNFIKLIHKSLSSLQISSGREGSGRSDPFCPIEDSIKPDYLICLEDGRRLKMLKRHLRTTYNMNPHQYRERWGLPDDYPMVAPSYSKKRKKIAKSIGLGYIGKHKMKYAA